MTKTASFLSNPFQNINKRPALEEKCCLLFSNIFLCSRGIQVFKICELATWWRHTLNQILSNLMEKDISVNLYQFVILCSKILLMVLHGLSLTVLLPWQHTGFQTFPILKCISGLAKHFLLSSRVTPRLFGLDFLPQIHSQAMRRCILFLSSMKWQSELGQCIRWYEDNLLNFI